jgi:hypothetical protein
MLVCGTENTTAYLHELVFKILGARLQELRLEAVRLQSKFVGTILDYLWI